jgi:hypothetical protein
MNSRDRPSGLTPPACPFPGDTRVFRAYLRPFRPVGGDAGASRRTLGGARYFSLRAIQTVR